MPQSSANAAETGDKPYRVGYTRAIMQLITTTAELARACEHLADCDFIAVDTEFMREQTFWPVLCLIQIATPTTAIIVDPMASGIDLAPFWQLMAN